MKESTQTLWFLGAAAAAVGLAVVTRPSDATYKVDDLVGKPLSRAFDPEEAKSLRIVRFDEETATLRDFEVAEKEGVWSIPSQGGYPADAERQMGEATAGLMDREILQVVSQSAADHADYGVVEPSETLEVGQTGVGTRVTLAKGDGAALVDLVVGKKVKDAESQRYVRRAAQDVVYVVEMDPESLSTDFADWIEDDLLKLSAFDIQRVAIKDYTAELVPQGFQIGVALEPRAEMKLAYDDANMKWTAEELRSWDKASKAYQPFELSEAEALDEDKLRDLKSALDDLRIVDVEKKPAGLSADLKAGDDYFKNQESALDLITRGFAPTRGASGENEILSTEGEVVCTLKTGVDYVLRFGNLQSTLDGEDSKEEAKEEAATGADEAADPDAKKEAEGEGVNRYLFVMARLNEGAVAKPELETVPDLPAEEKTASDDAGEEEDAAGGEAAEDGASADDADKPAAEDRTEELEKLVAERKAIEERNKQKQDEYEAKLKTARDQVKELNDRFGDWYYVIANDVYKKVRLGRDELIKKKESPKEEAPSAAVDATTPGAPLPGLPALPTGDDETSAPAEQAPDEEALDAETPATTEAPAAEAPAVEAPAAEAAAPSEG